MRVFKTSATRIYFWKSSQVYGAGLKPDDMPKPQIGVASVWWEGERNLIRISFNLNQQPPVISRKSVQCASGKLSQSVDLRQYINLIIYSWI